MDGKKVTMHEGGELRVSMSPPTAGIAMLTDEDLSREPERRIGIYKIVRTKSKPRPYLRWMGEQ